MDSILLTLPYTNNHVNNNSNSNRNSNSGYNNSSSNHGNSNSNNRWNDTIIIIPDSGASKSCFNNRSVFANMRLLETPIRLQVANTSAPTLLAREIGTVTLQFDSTHTLTLDNVLYVPEVPVIQQIRSDIIQQTQTTNRNISTYEQQFARIHIQIR